MTDIPFEFKFPPNGPSEHVARMATLYRLNLPDRDRPFRPVNATQWSSVFDFVLRMWRQRLSSLRHHGVRRFEPKYIPRASNCHPWGVAVKSYDQAVVYCRRLDICPWCYGREVSVLYTKVVRNLEPGDALVAITNEDFFLDCGDEEISQRLDWSRRVFRGLARANTWNTAADWSVTIEPWSRNRVWELCIRCRLLMLMPSKEPTILVPEGQGWKQQRVHNPNEGECQKLVARVCAYPVGLLRGPADMVGRILPLRSGLRLSECSGNFRGQPAEIPDEAGQDYENWNIPITGRGISPEAKN